MCRVASWASPAARRLRRVSTSEGPILPSFCHRSIPLSKKSPAAASAPAMPPMTCWKCALNSKIL